MSGFDINQLTITGNLTRDPELRSLQSGTAVCNIRIAHNDRRKVNGEWTTVPQYFDVTIWRLRSSGSRVRLPVMVSWLMSKPLMACLPPGGG